jgi:hypothetical protein
MASLFSRLSGLVPGFRSTATPPGPPISETPAQRDERKLNETHAALAASTRRPRPSTEEKIPRDFAAGIAGYANVQIRPRETRDPVNHTIGITFEVDEGARVYIERIDIQGNTQTLDRVIRREIALEGPKRVQFFAMNLRRPKFQDLRTRRALLDSDGFSSGMLAAYTARGDAAAPVCPICLAALQLSVAETHAHIEECLRARKDIDLMQIIA